ncbi:hypothetical protein NIES806_16840 [Dolichospermum compactum NIES-806]|uniref:Uncharacterized protein n=1 Tax=Dolichospermum compactum NIES-806 TaxID=1973481 RepID=A0A1Z4V1T0_9CYAN|nr:hypothetical protein NIES806_16840 [Dolichospermum compactum NIES-806]
MLAVVEEKTRGIVNLLLTGLALFLTFQLFCAMQKLLPLVIKVNVKTALHKICLLYMGFMNEIFIYIYHNIEFMNLAMIFRGNSEDRCKG